MSPCVRPWHERPAYSDRATSPVSIQAAPDAMTDTVETRSTNGAGADIDAVETSEWLEAVDAVVEHDGPDRARQILARASSQRAQLAGSGPIASITTPYVNTIPPEREAQAAGRSGARAAAALDRPLERDRDGRARQQASSSELGGHIASFQSLADAVRGRLQPLLARAVGRRARRRPRLLPGPLLAGQLRARVPRGTADRGAARRLPPGGLDAGRPVARIRIRG